jgi:benzil reductase ((S)-benzoin forming)
MRLYVITGTSRGIGEALAIRAAADDSVVIGVARGKSPKLSALAAQGLAVEQLEVDMTVPDYGVTRVLERVSQCLASKPATRAILINNAGRVDPIGHSEHLQPAEIAAACALNLAAPIALSAAFITAMKGKAKQLQVLNISSGAGRRPMPGWSVYCATKAGLDLYSQTLAAEQAAIDGARVVSLAPGVVDTAMQGRIREQDSNHFPAVANFVALKNEGKLASSDQVAQRIVAFLDSPQFGKTVIADLRELG